MAVGSLLEEARSRDPAATDEALVVTIAADLVELLDLEPPIEPGLVASYQGIRRIERSALAWAGCLVREGDDLVIRIRDTDTPGRQRFTICHEVATRFSPTIATRRSTDAPLLPPVGAGTPSRCCALSQRVNCCCPPGM